MKNEDNVKHNRFYIFYHDPKKPDSQPKYRTSTGSWDENFNIAHLWVDYEFVVKKAVDLHKSFKTGPECSRNRIVVIGKVIVAVDPFFPMEVV